MAQRKANKENHLALITIRIPTPTYDVRNVPHEPEVDLQTSLAQRRAMLALSVRRAFQARVWLLHTGLRPEHVNYGGRLDRKAHTRVLARRPWFPIQMTTNQRALGILHVGGQQLDVTYMKDSKMISLRMSLIRERKNSLVLGKSLEEFRRMTLCLRHLNTCGVCAVSGNDQVKGLLVFCQGCTFAYHQVCLGPRATRDHLVTKIADENFILQCRHCLGVAHSKDQLCPHEGNCNVCKKGSMSKPLRER